MKLLAPRPSSLLLWYDRHRRILPWRAGPGETPDPYRVWLSEIMLQQTTVATVGPYFRKFLQRWPTLDDLAAASLDDVLRLWAGLGYYRRARMLHHCARVLRDEHKGVFPREEKALLALPGFGPYTAAAMRAIGFDLPANVVDGNVERVMARVFAVRAPLPGAKKELREAAAGLTPQRRAGDYAQALMDLGATVCTPRSPKCGLCPWRNECAAHALGIEESLPRRLRPKARPVRRTTAFVLFNRKGEVFLRRRPPHGLLGGMMEVPSGAWAETPLPFAGTAEEAPVRAAWKKLPGLVRHVFTHFTLEAEIAVAALPARARPGDGQWVAPEKLAGEALPSVMNKMIRHALKSL